MVQWSNGGSFNDSLLGNSTAINVGLLNLFATKPIVWAQVGLGSLVALW